MSNSRVLLILALVALAILVFLGVTYCLSQAAKADVTPIIMPTKPTNPPMKTGVTVRPSSDNDGYLHTPTTMGTSSYVPLITAAPFGGMLG